MSYPSHQSSLARVLLDRCSENKASQIYELSVNCVLDKLYTLHIRAIVQPCMLFP